jgi:hypothetical protein
MKALRLPTGASTDAYLFRPRRPRDPPVFCVHRPRTVLQERWSPLPARALGYRSPAVPVHFTWTPIGSLRSPVDPSCTFAPLLDPGRTDVPLPWRSHRCCPRLTRQRGLRTMHISGLTHAASVPALLRFALHVAARAQGWLPAGRLAFTGRASNPLDRYERFQIVRHSPFLAS